MMMVVVMQQRTSFIRETERAIGTISRLEHADPSGDINWSFEQPISWETLKSISQTEPLEANTQTLVLLVCQSVPILASPIEVIHIVTSSR